jgi:threonine dehydrogenase-like Zn-dependent dehydrogenase
VWSCLPSLSAGPAGTAGKGELDASLLATHRFSIEDSQKGYEMFKTKEDGLLRAVFVPA